MVLGHENLQPTGHHRSELHPRTLRNAREQVKNMVAHGFSNQQIKHYLSQWAIWWAKTVEHWAYEAVLTRYIETCWDERLVRPATLLLQERFTLLCTEAIATGDVVAA